MHDDLHFLPQRPQPLHFDLSITGANTLFFEKNPSIVPTGHIELQYERPPFHAMMNRTMNEIAAMIKVGSDLIHTSVL